MPLSGLLIAIDATRQEMHLIRAGEALMGYPVSTARRGLGCRQDSWQTPTGWHRIEDRIGDQAKPGQKFIARHPTEHVLPTIEWMSGGNEDLILTRILRLRGLEPGHNAGPTVDSYDRFIYIHGTNQEQTLGQPTSHGCIRMANHDVVDLFNRIAGIETYCWIGQDDETKPMKKGIS